MSPPVPHAPDHDVRTTQLAETVRNRLWGIPGLFVVGAILLALVMRAVDRRLVTEEVVLVFDGDVGSAQTLLATIATSIITFTGLVVSVTVVALQLASQQFSPRVLRTFFRDTGTKVALGIFLGTFVYTVVVLRQAHEGGVGEAFVPRASITVAFVLVLVSLGAFVYYVDHVVHSIRIVTIIDSVAAETRAAVREVFTGGTPLADGELPDAAPVAVITNERAPGVVVTLDEDDLVRVARQAGAVIEIVPRMGEYVPSGGTQARVRATDGDGALDPTTVLALVGQHRERTMTQDVAFGFRQLVDIAEKALSPAINDPTTAVQAIDRMHDLLRRTATAPPATGVHRDAEGRARLVHPVPTWDGLLALACDEVRHYGAGSHQVQRRLRAMLDDLTPLVGAEGRAAIEAQRRQLDAAALVHFPDPVDRASATDPRAAL